MSYETLPIMDDQRTRETLDALAELFLTGPASGRDAQQKRQAAAPTASESNAANHSQQPMRLPPKLRTAQAPRPAMSMDVPPIKPATPASGASIPPASMDEPPTLRLTSSDRPRTATHASPGSPGTPGSSRNGNRHRAAAPALSREAVFLSNVPGFSGPWLTQYAHQLARQRGPIGVIHLDDHAIDIDVVSVFNPPMPQDAFEDVPSPDEMMQAVVRLVAAQEEEPDVLAVMHRLSTLPHHPVRHWLVRLSTPPSELDVQRAWLFDRWTIISGADETAVAAAAVLLERLTAEEHNAVDPERLETLQIAVAVVGSDPGLAGEVATRISDLADFIPQGVLPTIAQKQMVPVSREVVGAFADPTKQWPRIAAYLAGTFDVSTLDDPMLTAALPTVSQLAAAAGTVEYEEYVDGDDDVAASAPAQDDALARGRAMKAALLDEPADDEAATPPAVERRRPEPIAPSVDLAAEPAKSSTMMTSSATMTAAAPPQAAPVTQPASSIAAAAADEIDLASFLPAEVRQGMVALQARCPKHAKTQLALDEHGTVHLLRHHAASQSDDLRAAVVDLIEARLWVREHIELLRLTQRQCTFNTAAEPVLHLFTDQTKLATGLANKVGHLVSFHLLQQVHVGNQSTWFSAAMN